MFKNFGMFLVYLAALLLGGATLGRFVFGSELSPSTAFAAGSIVVLSSMYMANRLTVLGYEQRRGHVANQEDLRKGEFYQVLSIAETGNKGTIVILKDVSGQLYAHMYSNSGALKIKHWYRVADSTTTVGLLIEMPSESVKDKTAIETLNLGHVPPWLAGA